MMKLINNIDEIIILFFRNYNELIARLSIFTVYFWFGILKIFGFSPATPLVKSLFNATLSFFIPFPIFYILFSFFEVIIGITFLIKGLERFGIAMILFHLFTTALPLIFTPDIVWQSFLVPTLEGQYIIKNILIFASVVFIGSRLTPIPKNAHN